MQYPILLGCLDLNAQRNRALVRRKKSEMVFVPWSVEWQEDNNMAWVDLRFEICRSQLSFDSM